MDTPRSGATLFVETLEQYGIRHLFGNPGTTELPLMVALEHSDIEFVLGLHEDIAVGMAAGYAQSLRHQPSTDGAILPVGVVNLHVAPGLAHGLANLDSANYSGVPLVVTAGDHSTYFRHEEPILHGNLVAMAEPFTKWSAEVSDVAALPSMLRRAFKTALTPPTGPVFLSLPLNVLLAETDAVPERFGTIPQIGSAHPAARERAVDALTAATDVVLIVGDAVARSGPDAVDAAVEFAEAAGARVYAEILAGEISFPTDHEQWVSFLPPDERLYRRFVDADTVVFAGCSTNTTIVPHEKPLLDDDVTCIHVSDDAWEVGKNQPADVALVGDPGLVLRDIATHLAARLTDTVRRERIERLHPLREEARAAMRSIGGPDNSDGSLTTAALVDTLRSVAPGAFVVDEGVSSKYALLTRWPFAPGQYIATKSGTLGYGVPAAVGAAMAQSLDAEPRPVVAFVGDGAFQFYPQALYTAVHHGLDLTVVVVDNGGYRILRENTVAMLGGDYSDYTFAGMSLDAAVDVPTIASGYGAETYEVDTRAHLSARLESAIEAKAPTVVGVRVQADDLDITTPH